MKNLIFIFVFLSSALWAKAQDAFYYYKGDKIPLELERTQVNFRAASGFDQAALKEEGFKIVTITKDSIAKELTWFGSMKVDEANYENDIEKIKSISDILNVFPYVKKSKNGSVGTADFTYVKLKRAQDLVLLEQDLSTMGAEVFKRVPYMDLWVIVRLGDHSTLSSYELANKLYETKNYEAVDPAFMFDFKDNCSFDPMFEQLWGLKNTIYEGIDINICNAWNITQGQGINVAVLDQGIDQNHLDLRDNLHVLSFDANRGTSPSRFSGGAHGTHVAGTIAAVKDNNLQVVGVAPSSKLIGISHTLRLAPNISAELASGISWAWQNGADIINNSWGDQGGAYFRELHSLILEESFINAINLGRNGKGTLVVFAAGNKAPVMDYPGNFHPDILTVGAIQQSGPRALFSGYGDMLDVVAPGVNILSTIPNNSTRAYNGTSMAAPHVAGVAALVLSVASDLTGQQVRDIIESTAKKVSPHSYAYPYLPTPGRNNGNWNNEMGYGLVDAYQAVLKAQGYLKLDLHIRNSFVDIGAEPDPFTSNDYLYQSPDIWVRVDDDGQLEHQNPEYHHWNKNYVYVRVKNIGGQSSTVKDSLRLHWAKASTALTFPRFWDGSFKINNIPMGGIIGTLPIPALEPGATAILKFPWRVPNPNNYKSITPEGTDPWHFCLLGRVLSDDDPMTFIERADLVSNVRNNNNIAWKNLSVIEVEGNNPFGAYVLMMNPHKRIESYRIAFTELTKGEKELFKEAEIRITLGGSLYEAWVRGGQKGRGVEIDKEGSSLRILSPNAYLENLILEPQQYGTFHVSFNFLTREITDKEEYLFKVAQIDMEDESLLGGEAYLIRKKQRNPFYADAGLDREVNRGETIRLQARDIGEPATYNWYSTAGDRVHSGQNYSFNLEQNQKLQLEVIANDGFKDYDEVEIKLKADYLERIVPNPAAESVNIYYHISKSTQSYISIIPIYGAVGNALHYPVKGDDNFIHIDLSSFASGLYKIILYVDHNAMDSKSLLVD